MNKRVPSIILVILGGALGISVGFFVVSALQRPLPPSVVIQSPSLAALQTPTENASIKPIPVDESRLEQIERVTTTTELQTSEAVPIKQGLTLVQTTSTQYVVLAFDGSRSIDMWKQTRAFAKRMAEEGSPVHFTYFINTAYLLAPQHRNFYRPPQHATGTSAIGFASSEQDVANRLEQMNAVQREGHEIGCHLTGHYNGASWTKEEWIQEFQSFFDIVQQVGTINHLEQQPAERRSLLLPPEGIIGFRAPELGVNKAIWPVLQKYQFQYDTSLTAKPGAWPTKLASGLWEFPLTKIPFAGSSTSSLLSMDYNFFFKQSQAKEQAVRGTPLWDQYYTETLTSYRDYFKQSFEGNRAPIFIGHHFSLWNDGVYWEAMKTFATEVCGRPTVQCVSYKEVMGALKNR
jgi:hypothetical protein